MTRLVAYDARTPSRHERHSPLGALQRTRVPALRSASVVKITTRPCARPRPNDVPGLESYVADGRRTSSEVREVPQPDCGRKRNSLAQERRLAMNTSAAADALDQGDTDRARIRVRTGRLVLCIAREPSWLADGP